MPKNLSYALTIAALLAGPSLVMAIVSEVIGDPRLRPLSLSESRLAAADVPAGIEGPYVRARIYWSGPAEGFADPGDLRVALRDALAAKGVETHVAIMNGSGGQTMLDLRAGRNAFGPFPVAQAARHVAPAAEAARLAHALPTGTRD